MLDWRKIGISTATTRVFSVCVVLTAVGCYKSIDIEPPWDPPNVDLDGSVVVSGSRLQAEVWVSDDGIEIATGMFYDTVLEETCRFDEARDGGYRCFPNNVAEMDFHGVLFADDSCDEQVFVVPENNDEPAKYIADNGPDGCSGRKLYEVGKRINEDARMGANCSFSMTGTAGAARKGKEVPDHRFVRAEEVLIGEGVPRGRQLTAEDGAAILLGFYDDKADGACSPYETAEGWRCITEPSGGMYTWSGTDVFEGVTCWDVVLAWAGCEPPIYGINDKFVDAEIHELVPAEDATGLNTGTKACIEQAETWTAAPLFVFGDQVPSTRFPSLVRVEQTARISGLIWANSDNSAVLFRHNTGDLYDREADRSCWILFAADGEYRCLPSSRFLSVWSYADSECTVPLFSLRLFEYEAEREAESSEPLPALLLLFSDIEGREHVSWPGEAYTGESYREVYGIMGTDVTCTPASELTSEGAPEPLMTAGAEIPPEDFVRYEKVLR